MRYDGGYAYAEISAWRISLEVFYNFECNISLELYSAAPFVFIVDIISLN